ncbi:hypothetical protein [Brumimicrobium mesophilum]|nr:hypothetical protein [Brumimicrobium mesophilum]
MKTSTVLTVVSVVISAGILGLMIYQETKKRKTEREIQDAIDEAEKD